MFPFSKKKKEQLPDKTPRWFMWLMVGFVAYALLSNLLSDKLPVTSVAKPQDQKKINFHLLFQDKWDDVPAPFHVEVKEKGDGAPAQCWDNLALRYQLYNVKDEKLEENTKDQEPLRIVLGKEEVPPGLERGLLGMRAGEVRHVTARPDQAFYKTKFTHPRMNATDPAGWIVTLEAITPPAFPSAIGFGYRSYEEKTGSGYLLQCTDQAHVKVQAYGLDGKSLWGKAWEQSFRIGAGQVPFGIEKAMLGIRKGGKRTVILPAGFMKPLFAANVTDNAYPVPEDPDTLLLLDIEALTDKK